MSYTKVTWFMHANMWISVSWLSVSNGGGGGLRGPCVCNWSTQVNTSVLSAFSPAQVGTIDVGIICTYEKEHKLRLQITILGLSIPARKHDLWSTQEFPPLLAKYGVTTANQVGYISLPAERPALLRKPWRGCVNLYTSPLSGTEGERADCSTAN